MPAWYAARNVCAEKARPRTQLKNPRGLAETKPRNQLMWREDQTSKREKEQKRELMRVSSPPRQTLPRFAPSTDNHCNPSGQLLVFQATILPGVHRELDRPRRLDFRTSFDNRFLSATTGPP